MNDFSRFNMHDKLKSHCVLPIKGTRILTKGITLCSDTFPTGLLQDRNFKSISKTLITMKAIGTLFVSNLEV